MISVFNAEIGFDITTPQEIQEWANNNLIDQEPSYAPPDPVPTGDVYYFAEDGNDNASTNSINNPWQTLDKMKALIPSLNAGDAILFAMGNTFRFTAPNGWTEFISSVHGTATDRIIFSRYWKVGDESNTTLPLLTGGNTRVPIWTSLGNDIWQSTGWFTSRSRKLKDGIEQIGCESESTFNANTEIEFWQSDDTIKHRSVTDPNGSEWTYSDQEHILKMNYSSHIIINGLTIEHTYMWGGDIDIYLSNNVTIQNCEISGYSGSGVRLAGAWNNTVGEFEVIYNTFDTKWRRDYGFMYLHSSNDIILHNILDLQEYGNDCVVEHNSFIDFGHVALSFPYAQGITGGRWNYNYFDAPNSAYGRPFGGVDGGFDGLEIAYNIVNRCSIQSQVQGTNVHWHHNIFSNWFMGNKSEHLVGTTTVANISTPIQGRSDGHIIENNIFYNNEMQGIKIYANPAYDGWVRNNIFYNCGTALTDAEDARGISLTFIGYESEDLSSTIARTSNNNLFYDDTKTNYDVFALGTQNGTPRLFYKMTVIELNSAQWESSNNLEGNPLFIDTIDYEIPSNSPANDAGISPSSSIDYYGNVIQFPYNIGLYNSEADAVENPYLEPVNIPDYIGASNQVIVGASGEPFTDATFNNTQWEHFYLEPTTYATYRSITITNRNDTTRKTISLYDVNNPTGDTHPASLPDDKIAWYGINFTNSSYWTVDRLGGTKYNGTDGIVVNFYSGSEYNVLNRMYTKDRTGGSTRCYNLAHNNTIQNCRFEDQADSGGDGGVCTTLNDWTTDDVQIHNTKIINNEYYNQNDGFMPVRSSVTDNYHQYATTGSTQVVTLASNTLVKYSVASSEIPITDPPTSWGAVGKTYGSRINGSFDLNTENFLDTNRWYLYYQSCNMEGTIVDSNSFYKDIPHMENGCDVKSGSDNPDNPMIISNNRYWGYFEHPDYEPDGYVPGRTAMVFHLSPKNVIVENNIYWDNDQCLGGGSNGPATQFRNGFVTATIKGNIFYDSGVDFERGVFAMSSSTNVDVIDNTWVGSTQAEGRVYANTGTWVGNQVALPFNGSTPTWIDYQDVGSWSNSFEAEMQATPVVSNTSWGDYSFTWGKFGLTPEVITLPKVLDPTKDIISPL